VSVIRQDPTTRDWVILAPERAQRPRDVGVERRGRVRRAHDPTCPFCPGNEEMTPAELMRVPPERPGWAVRVVGNRFAALTDDRVLERREAGRLFREMDGIGHHEVIIETPRHDRTIAHMTEAEVEAILRAYQARYRALRGDARIRYVIIFKNHGERAGTSLEHPHSQIVATPVAPLALRQKYEIAIRHWDDTGRCLYCDVIDAELEAKARVVLETPAFVVFHPWASRAVYETWIAPRRHQPSFAQVSDADLGELARTLRATLRGLDAVLGDPDFNLIVHSAPVADEAQSYYLWHIRVLPRVATIAGFELGSGIYVSTVLPEESAARLRAAALSAMHPTGISGS
jgi:UDPglucose--hexose-1-phosphate uridylyltransferase